ncbi:hypothetical protein BCR35DRAFT_298803 [Leucosporidium creatinivorum]|uniref:Uncharacterized protein n=1 Tax=Leucosporidium creatinivorum TaxID=106004 RepID=A0A1Y2G2H1_9BASI|nr:hypothetical protein BCR35DRAFT_298803 [Leucosporidium creatinivorum]
MERKEAPKSRPNNQGSTRSYARLVCTLPTHSISTIPAPSFFAFCSSSTSFFLTTLGLAEMSSRWAIVSPSLGSVPSSACSSSSSSSSELSLSSELLSSLLSTICSTTPSSCSSCPSSCILSASASLAAFICGRKACRRFMRSEGGGGRTNRESGRVGISRVSVGRPVAGGGDDPDEAIAC